MKISQKQINTVFAVAVLNFLIFGFVAFVIGGDATSGAVVDGKYYVSNHSKLSEVGRLTWWYSYVHFYLSIVVLFVGLALKLFDHRLVTKPLAQSEQMAHDQTKNSIRPEPTK